MQAAGQEDALPVGAEDMAPGTDDSASLVGDADCDLGVFILNQFIAVVGAIVLLMETG